MENTFSTAFQGLLFTVKYNLGLERRGQYAAAQYRNDLTMWATVSAAIFLLAILLYVRLCCPGAIDQEKAQTPKSSPINKSFKAPTVNTLVGRGEAPFILPDPKPPVTDKPKDGKATATQVDLPAPQASSPPVSNNQADEQVTPAQAANAQFNF